ncbi:Cytochrome c oxidase subunit III [Variovorax sp. PBS-H4]|uniref:c-type cytochrome n=1 Tax=Variovorax sp. PBS-H4 TaxID=434008 RepID=UPI001315B9AF|nr:c-type cytochrome [Variovorax sp. PBS-H4]VTU41154.1 Cytochrome c oxidase subunit III [Variovorax sp. PBS-H4]
MNVRPIAGPAMVALLAALALGGCEREMRRLETPPDNQASPRAEAPRTSPLQPAQERGDAVRLPAGNGEGYVENAFAVAQGKRLYRWYNCNGCHAQGGGGIGPALTDDQWRYGSEPAQIFSTIVQGRPNGMPSFGGHLSEDQIWQLTAYVRSMSGQLKKDVEPGRADSLQANEPEAGRDREQPKPGAK